MYRVRSGIQGCILKAHPSISRPAESRAPSTSKFSVVRCTILRPCIPIDII